MRKLNQVVIIDDDEVNNLFCSIVIEHAGITGEVHCCTDGLEGLEYLANCIQSGATLPDLILLDINMPLVSGHDFLRQYLAQQYDRKLPCKIAMLSSSDMVSDVESALNYEFVIDYIVKPLSEDALNKVMQKLNLSRKRS